MTVHEITSEREFDDALENNKRVIVDYYRPSCYPCKVIAPMLEQHSEESQFKDVYFMKVDIGKFKSLGTRIGLEVVPTLVVFKEGKRIKTVIGEDILESDCESAKPNALDDFVCTAL